MQIRCRIFLGQTAKLVDDAFSILGKDTLQMVGGQSIFLAFISLLSSMYYMQKLTLSIIVILLSLRRLVVSVTLIAVCIFRWSTQFMEETLVRPKG